MLFRSTARAHTNNALTRAQRERVSHARCVNGYVRLQRHSSRAVRSARALWRMTRAGERRRHPSCARQKNFSRAPTFFRFARGTARNEHTAVARAFPRCTRDTRATRKSDTSNSRRPRDLVRCSCATGRVCVAECVRVRSWSRRRCVVPSRHVREGASAGQYEARDKVPGFSLGSPEQIRTAVTALRGRRPRPLDDGAGLGREQALGGSGGRTRTPKGRIRTCCVADYTTPEWARES